MNNLRFGLVASTALLSLACSPTVTTHSTPSGPEVSANITKVQNDTFVSLSIKRLDDSTSWKVVFLDEQPMDFSHEDIPGQTIVRWKLDSNRLKGSPIKPYHLNLMLNGNTYSTTVNFRTVPQQMSLDAIESVIIQSL